MANGIKHDGEAVALFGEAYAAIPKSVFAVACWHLAHLAAGGEISAEKRLIEEIEALNFNSLITPAQAKAAIRALTSIEGRN